MPEAGAAASAPGSAPAASLPSGPRPFEIPASPAWQAVDFISDLHLTEHMPATFRAFARHLLETPADAVFILGDLFEVWVGDDARRLPFESDCVSAVAAGAARRRIGIMVGNRDFLMGAELMRDCGALALPDPSLLRVFGRSVLLSHGDALCLDDRDYQQFRREVRGERWQREFLSKDLASRLHIAAEIRRQSTMRQRFDGAVHADVDAAAASGWLVAAGASELVHGHTHRPGSAPLSPDHTRHVLSDWDLDAPAGRRAQVLRLSAHGWQRIDLPAGSPSP